MERQLEKDSPEQARGDAGARLYEDAQESMLDKLDRTFVVQKGEGLWTIARKCLREEGEDAGNAHIVRAKIREIIELNRDRFPNLAHHPHNTYEGQWLLVRPPREHHGESERAGHAQSEEIIWKKAGAGSRVHAQAGDRVEGLNQSKVIAHSGSEVKAMNGAFILALPGSKVKAFHGSTVANYGGQVESWPGANVFEMGNITVPEAEQ
ncbi:MAG: hypothetical protein JSS86_04325 [Cyanobacteria bacterium SZAS LIN-2]|nr:hypothetical protein [Cyanobacteria bacterium SZAS LIN-3]MBS1995508.1 hypothetical protein [Cyanobacteria bacterium SZAS LIN-2]